MSQNVQKLPAASASSAIGFVVLPGFSLMSFASATEPLRAANRLAGKRLFNVKVFSETGGTVLSSGYGEVSSRPVEEAGRDLSALLVCAAGQPENWHIPRLYDPLRYLSRHGVRIGGISGGTWVLAAAGLMKNRDFTIHWEHLPAFREAFPSLEPRQARFVLDRDRLTCGGGIAPMDMMHALVAERLGDAFARRISDWFLHTAVSEASGPQRGALAERYGVYHSAVLEALERMEGTIGSPLERTVIAEDVGVSVRQLDRLFAAHLGQSFGTVYREIRLTHALTLLRQSPIV